MSEWTPVRRLIWGGAKAWRAFGTDSAEVEEVECAFCGATATLGRPLDEDESEWEFL